jgi:hypothetical protein
MKALKLIIIGIVLLFAGTAQAQVSVRLNLGLAPAWGPVGYDDARYYYLPDVESYYDVQTSMFIYNLGGVWVHRRYLPSRYRDYDLYGGYKVVMRGYRGNTPYYHFNDYRTRYARGYHGASQRTIGERPGRGYDRSREMFNGRSNDRMNQGNYRNVRRGNDRYVGQGNNRNIGHGNDRNAGRGNNNNHEKGQNNGHENGKK